MARGKRRERRRNRLHQARQLLRAVDRRPTAAEPIASSGSARMPGTARRADACAGREAASGGGDVGGAGHDRSRQDGRESSVRRCSRSWRREGRAKSHVETVESHLRVHIVPFFGIRPVDRIEEGHVARFLAHLRRSELAPKTVRNVASTLASLFGIAIRRRWILEKRCVLVDLPAAKPNAETGRSGTSRRRSSSPCSSWGFRPGGCSCSTVRLPHRCDDRRAPGRAPRFALGGR